MIIDLRKFVASERPMWQELEAQVKRLEDEPASGLTLSQARRLHHLYERAAAGLAQVSTFSGDAELRLFVETLVARAYAVISSMDRPRRRFRPVRWFFHTFPQTFRVHFRMFLLSVALTLGGCVFGGAAVAMDPDSKSVLMPFQHLQGSPADRVKQEEKQEQSKERHFGAMHSTFAGMLMANNIRVGIMLLALGVTWGVGTVIILFYNGVILGAVIVDYVMAGQSVFLAGWLLPHGVIEIPAVLIAGQAGLLLGWTIIGRQSRLTLRQRLRGIVPDMVTLILGVAVLLVWAGIVESFFSQYHQPVLPYWLKISFGCLELVLLSVLLAWRPKAGAAASDPEEARL